MILVGGGGHALSLAEFCGDRIEGYLAQKPNDAMSACWLGDDSERVRLRDSGQKFHIAFVYSGLPRMEQRRQLIKFYMESGCEFETVVAPTAIITSGTEISEGVAVMQGAIVNRAKIGENSIINSGAIIEHDCKIGNNTFIGPGAVIGGFTTVGDNCFIGLGARISNGVTIGNNITIGIGCIVSRSLSEPGIYHGCPMKHFKGRS